MTGRVEHHPVLCGVQATVAAPDDVVEVPSCLIGEGLVADRTEAVLCFPERHELSLSLKFGRHCRCQSLLEVDFPRGIVRVGFRFHLDVAGLGLKARRSWFRALRPSQRRPNGAHPLAKVAIFHPAGGLVGCLRLAHRHRA